MKDELSKSELKLIKALRKLKFIPSSVPKYDEENKNNGIIIAYLTAHQFDCADAMIEIIEKNKDKSFQDVWEELRNNGFFPEPEIVDDDELDEDEL